jgi:hypothetical protein
MWNDVVLISFKVLSRDLFGGIEENHENSQPENPVFRPRFEPVKALI